MCADTQIHGPSSALSGTLAGFISASVWDIGIADHGLTSIPTVTLKSFLLFVLFVFPAFMIYFFQIKIWNGIDHIVFKKQFFMA